MYSFLHLQLHQILFYIPYSWGCDPDAISKRVFDNCRAEIGKEQGRVLTRTKFVNERKEGRSFKKKKAKCQNKTIDGDSRFLQIII